MPKMVLHCFNRSSLEKIVMIMLTCLLWSSIALEADQPITLSSSSKSDNLETKELWQEINALRNQNKLYGDKISMLEAKDHHQEEEIQKLNRKIQDVMIDGKFDHSLRQERATDEKSNNCRACVVSKLCTFSYPDHPDRDTCNNPNYPDGNTHKTTNLSQNSNAFSKTEPKKLISTTAAPLTKGYPTNCQDLASHGHNLNGFYPVKSTLNKLKLIFCDFASSKSTPVTDQFQGYLNLKTSAVGVLFYVKRLSPFAKTDATVRFEEEKLNLGGAMNTMTGVFTTPIKGIYNFAFNGAMCPTADENSLIIQLRVNGKNVASASSIETSSSTRAKRGLGQLVKTATKVSGVILGGTSTTTTAENSVKYCSNVGLQSLLELEKGDKIDLYLVNGLLFDDDNGSTHFTGSLVEEEF